MNTSGLGLIGNYSDSDDEHEVFTTADVVKRVLLEDILTKVVRTSAAVGVDGVDDVMVIDRKPTFDVYRPRKRELSECSSVVTANPASNDDSSEESTDSSRFKFLSAANDQRPRNYLRSCSPFGSIPHLN